MAIFGQKPPKIRTGDRFVKVDDRLGRVWIVSRLWTAIDGVPHARLEGPEGQGMTMVVSVSTLNDRKFFFPTSTLG